MNPISFNELFNFKDSADVERAIKLIEKLGVVYNDMIHNSQKLSADYKGSVDLLRKSVEELNASAAKLNPTIKADQATIAATSKTMDVLTASSGALNSKINELSASEAKLSKERSAVAAKSKELNNIHQEAIKLEAQLGRLSGARAKEEAVLKAQIAQKRKEMALEAKEALGLVSVYDKQVAKMNALGKQYRDLVVLNKQATTAGRDLKRQFDQVRSSIINADQSIGVFNKNVGNYRSALGGLAGAGRQLLAGFGIVGGVTMFATLIKDTFELIKQSERLNKALAQVTETTERYKGEIRFLNDISNRYGINLNSLTNSYTKFYVATKGTNLEGEKTRYIFETVSKASAVMGLSADDTEGALRALGQMISKGKVQAEELRGQLGDRLPGAFQIMAKGLGVTTNELDGMLKRGELLAEEVLPKFATEMEKAFGLDTVQKVDTLQAAQTRLTNAWVLFVKSVEDGGGTISKVFISATEGMGDSFLLLKAWNDGVISFVELTSSYTNSVVKASVMAKIKAQELAEAYKEQAVADDARAQALLEYNTALGEGIKTFADFESKKGMWFADNKEQAAILAEIKKIYEEQTKSITKQIPLLKILEDRMKALTDARKGLTTEDQLLRNQIQIEYLKEEIDRVNNLAFAYKKLGEGLEDIKKAQQKDLPKVGGITGLSEVPDQLAKVEIKTESTIDKLKRKLSDFATDIQKTFSYAMQAVSDVGNQMFRNQQINRENEYEKFKEANDKEIDALEEKRDLELKNESLSSSQKEAINKRYDASIQALERAAELRRKRLQRQQAESAKKQAIFNAIINTATGVTAALARYDFAGAIAIGALGGLQVALIASEPLPAFEKGTDYAPAGDKIVGEKGRELVITPSGRSFLTGNKAEVRRDIPEGSQILTNAITERILGMKSIDVGSEANNESYNRIRKNNQSSQIEAMRMAFSTSLERENDVLINGIARELSKLPLNNWSFTDSGQVTRSVKKGNMIIEKVSLENKYR